MSKNKKRNFEDFLEDDDDFWDEVADKTELVSAKPSPASFAIGANAVLLSRLIGFAERAGSDINKMSVAEGLNSEPEHQAFFDALNNFLEAGKALNAALPRKPLGGPTTSLVENAKALAVTDLGGRKFTIQSGIRKGQTSPWGDKFFPEDAARTLIELLEGVPNQKKGGKLGDWRTPPATTNAIGCWLPGTLAKINESGHAPVSVKFGRKYGELKGVKSPIELVHRLSVLAWKPLADITLLLEGGDGSSTVKRYEVSHLCHQANCFNPSHLLVEAHSINHGRNPCQYGHRRCPCSPPCILALISKEEEK